VVAVRCGECVAGGKELGCLKEISVTALHTTVTITDSGELVNLSLSSGTVSFLESLIFP